MQYVVIYFPHGANQVAEANGPYRSHARAEREVERLERVEDEHDVEVPLAPSIVALGEPTDWELSVDPEVLGGRTSHDLGGTR